MNPSEKAPRLEIADEFKQLLIEHPEAIPTFTKLRQKARETLYKVKRPDEMTFEENGMKVTCMDNKGEPDSGRYMFVGKYFKVEFEGQTYFVKCKQGHPTPHIKSKGDDEFRSMELLKEITANLDNVEVVDFQFGYQGKDGKSYFVSKWIDNAINLRYYIKELEEKSGSGDTQAGEEKTKLDSRVELLMTELKSKKFFDVQDANMLYDPETEKIILFDIHLHSLEDSNPGHL